MAQRQWAYHTTSQNPFVTAVADTRIVLLKLSCWSSAADGIFTLAGSTAGTILQVQIGEDASFGVDNLHLAIPIGEDLDLAISGTGGITVWWYVIKDLGVSTPDLD